MRSTDDLTYRSRYNDTANAFARPEGAYDTLRERIDSTRKVSDIALVVALLALFIAIGALAGAVTQ